MADRTAAAIFGMVFSALSKHAEEPWVKRLASRLWNETGEFDFSPYQIEDDSALMRLGLAKKGISKEYPEDGEVVLYKGRDY
jgi:hypothetical protein